MIQPHLPIRLPCYDFTPIIRPTLDCCLYKLAHRLWVFPTLMVWRAVCTRAGNVFTAVCWPAITSNSDFMKANFSLQSELRLLFLGLLFLADSFLSVVAIVVLVLPRTYRAWWFDVVPTFLRFLTGSLARVPNFTCWQLTIGVALVAGLNPTSHDTSWRQPCTTCIQAPKSYYISIVFLYMSSPGKVLRVASN